MSDATVTVESSKTSGLTPRERTDFWISLVSSYHGEVSWTGPRHQAFDGTLITAKTDMYQLVNWQSTQVGYQRTASHIRQSAEEDYRVVIPTGGQVTMWQGDQASTLLPGSAGLMTLARPFTLTQSPANGFALTIPREQLDSRLNVSAPFSARLDMTAGLGRIIGELVAGLFSERDALTAAQFNAVNGRVIELLCLLAVGDDRPNATPHLADVESTVRRYVRQHAADPDLTGHSLARALGWSLRQVQLVLQRAGTTPRELIKDERLTLARDRLESPAYQHLSITEVAYQLGFCSLSTFSTAFKDRFGVRPSVVRR